MGLYSFAKSTNLLKSNSALFSASMTVSIEMEYHKKIKKEIHRLDFSQF